MPQVPVYDGPQVATRALRTPGARPLDVSSGTRAIGQGLANLAEGIDRNLETRAQTRANEIETNLTDEYNQWADTEQPKAVNQNASTWRSRVEAWWEDAKGRYGKDLDPYAERKVTEILARRRSIALNEAGRYQSVQEERYADSTAFSAMESAASSAVRSGAYDLELNRTRDLVYEMAARKSLDKDQRDALMAEQVGKFHRRVIDNLSAEQGLAYYDANAADIGDKPLRDALERNIKVEQKQREAEAEKAKREAEDRLVDSAWSLFAQREPVPPSVLAALPGREAAQLANAIESRAAREMKGATIKTDDKLYNQTLLDIASGERVDLRPLVESFAQADMDRLVKLQQDMSKPDTAKEVASQQQMISNYKAGVAKSQQDLFERRAWDEFNTFRANNGRDADFKERTQILNNLLLQGEVVSGNWYSNDPDLQRFQVDPNDLPNWVPDISSDEYDQIVEALKSEGVSDPTDAQIMQRYMMAKGLR